MMTTDLRAEVLFCEEAERAVLGCMLMHPDEVVLEVAFEGLARSPRHKSGVAMRFPRISRLRWDKPPREADRLETLERMLKTVTTN